MQEEPKASVAEPQGGFIVRSLVFAGWVDTAGVGPAVEAGEREGFTLELQLWKSARISARMALPPEPMLARTSAHAAGLRPAATASASPQRCPAPGAKVKTASRGTSQNPALALAASTQRRL